MKKLLVCAAALSGFAVQANAADLLAGAKDPIPDALTYKGVTVYGTVDVGYGYVEHGLPFSGANYNGYNYIPNKYSDRSQSGLTNNALSQSIIGVKIEEQLGLGFTAIGKLDTGFNPASGEIADACASLVRAGSKKTEAEGLTTFGDGSRCGQMFNGQAYGGLSNPLYGTLTFGRQNTLLTDAVGAYDPLSGSYAFSLLGSGTYLSGIGSTETSRWNNSVKYLFSYGPAHVAAMYSSGAQDSPIFQDAYGANVGVTYKGFSLDGYYTKENGAAGLSNGLAGTVTDNEAWSAVGKYTFEFGGGFKDEGPKSKLTLFAGYNRSELSNPEHTQGYYNGYSTLGGYQLVTVTNATGGYNLFGSNKVLETAWAGATYQTGPWSFTGAYYHADQDDYLAIAQKDSTGTGTLKAGKTYTCAQASGANNVTTGNHQAANCAGDLNMGSFVVDYAFNKHFDIYAGVSVVELSGGLASGFLQTDNVSFASGLRLKF